MLQTQAVEPKLLELLNALMRVDLFHSFSLVGDTALALQAGHRKSVDIDLFGKQVLDEISFSDTLNELGTVQVLSKSKNILINSVNGIKVDFVNYRYDWLEEPQTIEGVRLASRKDIAAMKLNAIAGRGSRKDFIDLFELMKSFSLKEMLKFYERKYSDGSTFMVLKSLTYFDDAESEQDPEVFATINWEGVKDTISREVSVLSGIGCL